MTDQDDRPGRPGAVSNWLDGPDRRPAPRPYANVVLSSQGRERAALVRELKTVLRRYLEPIDRRQEESTASSAEAP